MGELNLEQIMESIRFFSQRTKEQYKKIENAYNLLIKRRDDSYELSPDSRFPDVESDIANIANALSARKEYQVLEDFILYASKMRNNELLNYYFWSVELNARHANEFRKEGDEAEEQQSHSMVKDLVYKIPKFIKARSEEEAIKVFDRIKIIYPGSYNLKLIEV